MTVVYAVQQQMRYDTIEGKLVSRFASIHKAERWGEIIYLLSPDAHPFDPERVIGTLHHKLNNFSSQDFLLLIGSPGLIGMAMTVAAHYNKGRVNFLQWSGRNMEYTEVITKIY